MSITARLFIVSLVLCCTACACPSKHPPTKRGRPTAVPGTLSKQIIGRWENSRTGIEFQEGGKFGLYRESRERVYQPGTYKVIAPNRIHMERAGGSQEWVVKKIARDELVVSGTAGREETYKRATRGVGLRPLDSLHCEINMRTILTVEEQYKIDHAVYKAVGTGESFVAAGLFTKEPRCPGGGAYTVTIEKDGAVVVHCTVKEHDFKGRGVR